MDIGRPRICNCGSCQTCKGREAMRRYSERRRAEGRPISTNRAICAEYERRRYHEDPVFRAKKKARNMVTIRIARGTMIREPCEICGVENAQAHHDDYSKPLLVRWLCKDHHAAWHEQHDAVAF